MKAHTHTHIHTHTHTNTHTHAHTHRIHTHSHTHAHTHKHTHTHTHVKSGQITDVAKCGYYHLTKFSGEHKDHQYGETPPSQTTVQMKQNWTKREVVFGQGLLYMEI